ncbi:MAG: cytochrome c3 family protein [Planctomycetota bacterium]
MQASPLLVALASAVTSGLAFAQGGLDESTASCATCHREIHREWKAGAHAGAWLNPIYRNWIKTKKRPKSCHSCHIPAGVLASAPRKPKARAEDLDEGVRCATCHVLDGKVQGPFGAETDAHPSQKSELFGPTSIDLCLSCHNRPPSPNLPLGRDFTGAKLRAKGKSCKGCHMPETERHMAIDPATGKPVGPKRKGRSHRPLGPSDPEFLVKAFSFSVLAPRGTDGASTTLVLANKAGHRIPGIKIRSFLARFDALDEGGRTLWSKEERIDAKNPILVLEKRSVSVDAPEGTVSFRLRIRHLFKETKTGEWQDLGLAYEAVR